MYGALFLYRTLNYYFLITVKYAIILDIVRRSLFFNLLINRLEPSVRKNRGLFLYQKYHNYYTIYDIFGIIKLTAEGEEKTNKKKNEEFI